MARTKQAALSSQEQVKKQLVRHRKTKKDYSDIKSNIKIKQIERLCRRSGAPRVSSRCIQEIKQLIEDFTTTIVKDGLVFKDYRKKKGMSPSDVRNACKSRGWNVYGIGNKKYNRVHKKKQIQKQKKEKDVIESQFQSEVNE